MTSYAAKHPDAAGFIDYTDEEDAVWRDLVARQWPMVHRHAAQPYLRGLEVTLLEEKQRAEFASTQVAFEQALSPPHPPSSPPP